MKKYLFVVAVIFLVFVFAAGCANQADIAEPDTSDVETSSEDSSVAVNGETFEAERFSITVPDGWEVMEVDGGVMIYKNSGETIQVYYRGENMNESEAQTQTEALASQYSGTAAKEVELLGKTFWATTFTASGVYQTSYMRIEDGVKLSIQCAGADHETDPDFAAILNSIVFK